MDEFGAEFDGKIGARVAHREDAATDAVASFEQDDAETGFGEFAGSGESGDASSEDDNVSVE